MILMENGQKTVVVSMNGIISQLEELDLEDVRRKIKKVNPKTSTPTVVAVLEEILAYDILRFSQMGVTLSLVVVESVSNAESLLRTREGAKASTVLLKYFLVIGQYNFFLPPPPLRDVSQHLTERLHHVSKRRPFKL